MASAESENQGAASLALYRKYRPATFAELRGQDHVTGPLSQALRSGRINHAYLFSGPRGCGKTSSARILARSLNCVNGPTPEPCGVCDSCIALAPSGPGSIDVMEIDAASHGGVDDARDLRERAFYSPVSGRFKIYIIDEAHMVTTSGFNALLKLVEEPPPHLKFIFATTEPEKVIPTIRSRTHHYPFRLVPPSVLRELMQDILRSEGVTVEEAVLPLVIRAGAGSARDTLSVLDQLLAGSDASGLSYERAVSLLGYTDDSLLDQIVEAFAAADGAAAFGVVNRVIEAGHEPRRFAADLLDRFRDLIVLAAVPDAAETGLLDLPADRAERMSAQAGKFGQAGLTRAAEIVNSGLDQMRGATSPRLLLELTCAQVLLPGAATDEVSLLTRLERLERTSSERLVVPAPSSPVAPAAQPPQAAQRPQTAPSAPPASASPASAPSSSAPPAPAAVSPAAASAPAASTTAWAPAATPGQPAPAATSTSAPTPAPVAASAPPGGGGTSADSLRANWPAILEAIKRERRVAWMILSNASVHSLQDNILTLRFARDGDLKGFTTSGCDADLKRVLSSGFGVNVMVNGTVSSGGDDPPGPPRGRGDLPPESPLGTPRGPAPPVRRDPTPSDDVPPPPDSYEPEEEPDDEPLPPGPPELSGMDLIQRELGGQIISED
jgi:DNA polymerase-3 subunit gamma/tau